MRAWLWILFPLLAAALLISGWGRHERPQVQTFGEAQIGGAFTLINTDGRRLSDSDFRGRPMLVYMGYSNCPDICPMTLEVMGDALKILGPDADKVAAIFITLDPDRDTPEVLGKYLAHFDKRIVGLTGSREEIAGVAVTYKTYYKKSATPGTEAYLVDHSGFLYLMDAQGKYVRHFGPDVKAEELVKAIKELF